MGILDEIKTMKDQGMEENQILGNLQERGFSPKAIDDALNQMKIKKAVSAESSGEEGMEPSIMKGNQDYGQLQAPLYSPKTQEIGHEPTDTYSSQTGGEFGGQDYGGYGQEEYIPQEGYGSSGGTGGYDTDTFIEIAEQVFLEKIKKEQKQISSLSEFAALAETKISNNHERIKRIESIIDKLQAAILEKIGAYGKDLDFIKNETGMMQESFEKMIPELHEKSTSRKKKKSSKKK